MGMRIVFDSKLNGLDDFASGDHAGKGEGKVYARTICSRTEGVSRPYWQQSDLFSYNSLTCFS
jgi:hypothetical protein